MSELDCIMWVYATPNVHVKDILQADPSEACFVAEVHADTKEGIFTMLSKEPLVKILGVGGNQADLESLYPLPVRVQQLLTHNSPNCHARHMFGCSTRRTLVRRFQYAVSHTNCSCNPPYSVIYRRSGNSTGLPDVTSME
jgi:hypothetical protein